MFPIGDDNSVRRLVPLAAYALIVLNVLFFLLEMGGGATVNEFQSKILPALANGLNQLVKDNNAAAPLLLQAFDSDKDKTTLALELEKKLYQ